MIYQSYQARSDALRPLRASAALAAASMRGPWGAWANLLPAANAIAALELFAQTRVTHTRPAFGIETTTVGNRTVPVTEEVAARTPFATLLHFAKDVDTPQPRMLVVAPLSGHFATLLRNTIEVLLPDKRRLRHRLAQRPRRAAVGWPVRLRRVCRPRHRLPRGDRSRCPSHRRLPAVRARARRRGRHGRGRQPGAATLDDADGRAGRHPRQPVRGEQARHRQADRVVRAQSHRHRAGLPPGGGPAGLSGLRAADGVHEHERRSPPQRACRPVPTGWWPATPRRSSRCAPSTTSTSPSSTSLRSSFSRR